MRPDSWSKAAIVQTAPTWPSGTYLNQYVWTTQQPSVHTAFGAWRGSPSTIVTLFCDYSSWSGITGPGPQLAYFNGTPWAAGGGAGIAYALGMVPTGVAIPTTANTYNSNFATFASNLQTAGYQNCIIRLGWEFNLPSTTWPWAANAGNLSAWIAYWQQIVTTLKATCPGVRIVWCVNRGQSAGLADPTTAYPGDAYVDMIGVDSYDWYNAANTPGGWASQTDVSNQGLSYWYNYAVAHTKQFCVPEWGIGYVSPPSGGDDPAYIQNMHAFFAGCGSNLGYESLFQGANLWPGTSTPESAAMYQSLWGH